MKNWVLAVSFFSLSLSSLFAQAPLTKEAIFEIRNIKRETKGMAYVDSAWKNHVPCVEVSIRSEEDIPDKLAFARAYFFNKNKEIIARCMTPTLVSNGSDGTASIPDFIKGKEKYSIFFAIPTNNQSGKDKWDCVVVVFGKGKEAVAEIFPSGDVAPYDFPEKGFATVETKKK